MSDEFTVYNWDDYHSFVAIHTRRDGTPILKSAMIQQAALGIASEAGEIAGIIKKAFYEGWVGGNSDVWQDKLILECGDLLFYLTEMCNGIGENIVTVRGRNVAKLQARYPKGYFDAADSLAKADEIGAD